MAAKLDQWVRSTLGDLTYQVLTLTAENAALKEQLAEAQKAAEPVAKKK